MKNVNVLVTGAGAGVGQGILRSLRMMKDCPKIITADPDYRAAGHWLGNKGYLIPFAHNSNYESTIKTIIKQEHIDVVFVGTDVELSYFANNKNHLESLGAKVIVNPPQTVDIADDKWLTVQFLKDNGFPYPQSALATDTEACEKLLQDCGLPLFGKPRKGARSVGARVIKTIQELNQIIISEPDLIIQELLPDTDGEYTAGCVGFNNNINGVVVLKRDLRDGNTYRAYYDGVNLFEKEIINIATKLGIEGSCNFQFRVKDNKPIIFEINARFSGTTPLRAIFGFNEVESILNYLIKNEPIIQPTLRSGAVFRTWSDIFVDKEQLDDFQFDSKLYKPNAESIPFIINK